MEHTRLTHSYLVDDQQLGERPIYPMCNDAVMTVEHRLVTCPHLRDLRRELLSPHVDDISVGSFVEIGCLSSASLNFFE